MSSQSWFDFWEIAAAIGTVMVIVGLWIEYDWSVSTFLKWGRGKREIPEYHVKVESPRERKGGVLVVFGITIELLVAVGMFVQSLRVETQRRKEIVELERELSPRLFEDQGKAIANLTPFAGTQYVIKYLSEVECHRMAGQINMVLNSARWASFRSMSSSSDESEFFDGVMIQTNAAGAASGEIAMSETAGSALVSALNATRISARSGAPDLSEPQGVVVIRVGMKPNPEVERLERKGEEDLRIRMLRARGGH